MTPGFVHRDQGYSLILFNVDVLLYVYMYDGLLPVGGVHSSSSMVGCDSSNIVRYLLVAYMKLQLQNMDSIWHYLVSNALLHRQAEIGLIS